MVYKDLAKEKATKAKIYQRNKEKYKKYNAEQYEKNKEMRDESDAKRREERKQNAYDSISSGTIININKWNVWCNRIKGRAKTNKQPYSDDFTNDVMFEMMIQGCFYCGDIATTIDRIDSKLDHTVDNCVGSCEGCNISKGAVDLSTFIRKAYYRARGNYIDNDTDIWFVYKQKPSVYHYKRNAEKQRSVFELTDEYFENLITGDCKYCKRTPDRWFGIDKVVPSLGYVNNNVVSCCFDCNIDKLEDDVDTMRARNEKIAGRMESGKLDTIVCEKMILNRRQTKSFT